MYSLDWKGRKGKIHASSTHNYKYKNTQLSTLKNTCTLGYWLTCLLPNIYPCITSTSRLESSLFIDIVTLTLKSTSIAQTHEQWQVTVQILYRLFEYCSRCSTAHSQAMCPVMIDVRVCCALGCSGWNLAACVGWGTVSVLFDRYRRK